MPTSFSVRPALADHDPLLRVPLDQDLAADPGPLPLGDPAGDAVGQLVLHPVEQLLADQVRHPEGLGHVGDHALGVVAGALGHPVHHGVDEGGTPSPVAADTGKYSTGTGAPPPSPSMDSITSATAVRWVEDAVPAHPVDLVDHHQQGRVARRRRRRRPPPRSGAPRPGPWPAPGGPRRSSTIRSPGPTAPVASTMATTTSTSSSDEVADSFIRSPSAVRGLCRPGVSTNTTWASDRLSTPRTWDRVVLGRGEVMETLVPTMALTRVDFPTLGRPDHGGESRPEGGSCRLLGAAGPPWARSGPARSDGR